MALKKDLVREDGCIGTYIRLVDIIFPEIRKSSKFKKFGILVFHVFRDEIAAKEELRDPFKILSIEVTKEFFAGINDIFGITQDELISEIYLRKEHIPQLQDAEDLI